MNPTLDLAIVLVAVALFAIGGAFALYVFAKAMLLIVQTIAFSHAAGEQAKSSADFERAAMAMQARAGKTVHKPELHSDEELRAAAMAGRASTGESFIPGYDEPPPQAGEGESFSGAHNDGETPGSDSFAPAGGLYRDGRSQA